MNDSPLDREIQSALNVEPSSEFVARIRARVEQEPVRGAWHLDWRAVVCGAVAASVLVFVVVRTRLSQDVPRNISSDALASKAAIRAPEPAVAWSPPNGSAPSAQAAVTPRDRSASRRTRASSEDRTAEPEVLVPRAEIEAFRRLLVSIGNGDVDVTSLELDVPPATEPLPALLELSIEPVVIEPLAPVTH